MSDNRQYFVSNVWPNTVIAPFIFRVLRTFLKKIPNLLIVIEKSDQRAIVKLPIRSVHDLISDTVVLLDFEDCIFYNLRRVV